MSTTTNRSTRTNAARIDALEAKLDRILAALDGNAPAAPVAPKVTAAPKKAAAPKAEPRFRTEAQKAKARAKCDALWTEAKAKAGVKRVKDLTPKQRDAVQAACKAVWASTKGTRKTPAN